MYCVVPYCVIYEAQDVEQRSEERDDNRQKKTRGSMVAHVSARVR